MDSSGRAVVIRTTSPGTLATQRLAPELDLLNEHADSGIACPVHIEETSSGTTLTRPFVAGPPLSEQLAIGSVTSEQVIELAITLFATLERLHVCGLVHGNIKPSNIVLAGGVWHAPVLVDFGVTHHAILDGSLETISLDSVRYLAPEQAGLLERGVDGRADLYAVGLVMYEAVGRQPFSAASVSELLRQQLTLTPAPLANVPAGLAGIIERLLRKDPRDRYQTAAGVRADLDQLRRGHELAIGARDRRSTITEPAFTGRRDELASLLASLQEASAGHGGIALLAGESGSGKTWILDELRRLAIQRGAWVVRGQGTAQIAHRPYHVLSGIMQNLVASTPAESKRRARLIDRVGEAGTSIVEALPAASALFGAARPSPEIDPNVEHRTLANLTMLLDGLGTETEPAVVLVDDAQWADALTLRLLERWNGEGRYVLVVLAFRSEEVDADHPLRHLSAGRHIDLGKLSDSEVRQQIGSMAGDLPARLVELVLDHSAGNPFVVSALMYGLVESHVLVSGPDGWQFAEHALGKFEVSRTMADTVAARIAWLSAPARRLLSVGAILGKTFDPIFAGELCSLEARETLAILRELRGRFVWLDGTGCVFVHDRIREALLAELGEEERRKCHLEAAERLPDDRVFDLAYHFDAAGAAERALPSALEAADRAKAQHDIELAERYYRISARGLSESADTTTRFRVTRGLGDVLLIRSQYEDSARYFDEAARVAPDRMARADIEERRAQLALKQGHLPGAIEHGERALRLAGRYVPRSSFVCLLIVLWEVIVQALHTKFPRRFVGRRQLDGADEEMFAIRIYNTLNGPYFFARGVAWVLWVHLRALNLAERYPPSRALGREYGNHGSACAGFPSLFERAIRYTRRGADICAQLGDIWGQARALQFHALNLCATGRYREAIEAAELGGKLFDRAGDMWNAQFALNWASLARYRMGDLVGSAASAKQLYERGKRLDSALGISFALDAWVRAAEGHVPEHLIKDELERPFEHVQTWSLMAQSEAIRLLACDQPAEAEELLATWLDRMQRERALVHESNVSMIVYLGVAQRRRAELLAATDPAESARVLENALATSRRAMKRTRRFRNCIPHALREAAVTEAMAGNHARARALIEKSIAAARQLDARFELALSRVVRGELGPALRGTELAKDLERARAELTELRAPLGEPRTRITVSLVDRFEAVLDVGRRIAKSLVEAEIYATLQRGTLALLRAEHAAILDRNEQPVAGELRAVSSHLIAAAKQHPVLWSELTELEDDAFLRAGVRSALCAPIFVRGDHVATLCATHSEVRDAFGEEERKIVAFLTALAGAALENGEGFAQLSALSRELEGRVEARTADLATANAALAENLQRLQATQEQLVHAGRMAAIGTLVAGLSHELNNPLTVILGNIEHLESLVPAEPRVSRMLDAIARHGKRAASLIETLLRFSRMRSHATDEVKPDELIHEVIQLVAAEARTRDIELSVAVDEELPRLVVTRHDIESALVNLTTNALQATSAGGRVELRAKLERRDSADGVCFSVRDTGSGISPDVLPRIFDPFFTTKPEGEGTGLGLSLAREAATAHGGWLDAESTLGAGTAMRLWLPVSRTSRAGE